MNAALFRSVLGAGFVSIAVAGSASAGGFARGTADTDILYEDGNFAMRTGITYVSPTRKFSEYVGAPGLVGTNYTADYVIPSAAIKINVTDDFRCAATLVDNNGGSASYAVPTPTGKLTEEFTTNEKAITCGARFQVGSGYAWVLGGGFVENFDYGRRNSYGPVGGASLQLKGEDTGYRLGLAYEIPEIALRGQVLYRSGTYYGAEGMLRAPAGVLAQALANQGVPAGMNPFAGLPPTTQVPVDALGFGNLPQSVDVKFQTGIAPGWLAFGQVKWTDWSVLKSLDVRSKPSAALPGSVPISSDIYNWRDGWTVTGGIGHAFNDSISGALSLTWDRGVATGWDLSSDTYTLAAGAVLKDQWGGELRGGLGVSRLTSAATTQYANTPAGGFNSAVDAGWAFAANLGYKIAW